MPDSFTGVWDENKTSGNDVAPLNHPLPLCDLVKLGLHQLDKVTTEHNRHINQPAWQRIATSSAHHPIHPLNGWVFWGGGVSQTPSFTFRLWCKRDACRLTLSCSPPCRMLSRVSSASLCRKCCSCAHSSVLSQSHSAAAGPSLALHTHAAGTEGEIKRSCRRGEGEERRWKERRVEPLTGPISNK